MHIIIEGRGFRGGSDEKLGECGSDEKLLWLAFLPTLYRMSEKGKEINKFSPMDNFNVYNVILRLCLTDYWFLIN